MQRLYLLFYFLFSISCGVFSQVQINEIVSDNSMGIQDEDGDFVDWIELYNNSEFPINLNSYYLTDNRNDPFKWIFPDITVNSHDHFLVFASGKQQFCWQTIIDMGDVWRYQLPTMDLDDSWKYIDYNDESWNEGKSGFGYGDGDDSTILEKTISVFIRKKFTVSNIENINRAILHVDFDDGFVAYLNGVEIARSNIEFNGLHVPYNQEATWSVEANLYKGKEVSGFPIYNLKHILKEGENILAIQGHNRDSTSSDLSLIPFLTFGLTSGTIGELSSYLPISQVHSYLPFKIKSEGETIYIFNKQKEIIDSVASVALPANISYGRIEDGSKIWGYFVRPTPDSTNSTSKFNTVLTSDSVGFSQEGGFYNAPIHLELHADSRSDTIYYTTDGSDPDRYDKIYTKAIKLDKTTVIKAAVLSGNSLLFPVTTNTYFFNVKHTFPVISLTTDSLNLFDYNSGIYVLGPNASDEHPRAGANFWQDWEKPAYFEYFDLAGNKKVDQAVGIKIFGNYSRAYKSKSFTVYARKEYGQGTLKYKFFEERAFDEFESIILRNSGSDFRNTMFRDGFMTSLVMHTNLDRQAFQPSIVYINGTYWGILNIREKLSEHFISSNHLVDPDNVSILSLDAKLINGFTSEYLKWKDFYTNNSLVSEEYFNMIPNYIDLDNFMLYQLTELYYVNTDWPRNNIKYWRTNGINGRWRWILYDTDLGFGLYDNSKMYYNWINTIVSGGDGRYPLPEWSTLMFRKLIVNQSFRERFANMFADHINTTFKTERVNQLIDSLRSMYAPEMQAHIERWEFDHNMKVWNTRIDNMKRFSELRPAIALRQIDSVFQFQGTLDVLVDVYDKKRGKVKINSVVPVGFPFIGKYFKNVPIKLTALPNPGYKFRKWTGTNLAYTAQMEYSMVSSGEFVADFMPADERDVSVIINEINFNSSKDLDSEDWIELYNNGAATVDLYHWRIGDANIKSEFVFKTHTVIYPGEYLVICKDLHKFKNHHPMIENALGDFSFGLGRDNESIYLISDKFEMKDKVEYNSYEPWPMNNMANGATMELRSVDLNNDTGESWQSSDFGGTPGRKNHGFTLPPVEPFEFSIPDPVCFPNPFRDFTTIEFKLNKAGGCRLEVLDISGQRVRVLLNTELREGSYFLDWYGDNASRRIVSKGLYFIKVSTPEYDKTIKVVYVK